MKTVALDEKTFELLRRLKEREKKKSFDELVLTLMMEKENVPDSLFGSLKGKTKRFSSKERKEIWAEI